MSTLSEVVGSRVPLPGLSRRHACHTCQPVAVGGAVPGVDHRSALGDEHAEHPVRAPHAFGDAVEVLEQREEQLSVECPSSDTQLSQRHGAPAARYRALHRTRPPRIGGSARLQTATRDWVTPWPGTGDQRTLVTPLAAMEIAGSRCQCGDEERELVTACDLPREPDT